MALHVISKSNDEKDLLLRTISQSIISSHKIVVIAGAGISNSSGIPVNFYNYMHSKGCL
jgi:hypothetical protein